MTGFTITIKPDGSGFHIIRFVDDQKIEWDIRPSQLDAEIWTLTQGLKNKYYELELEHNNELFLRPM